MLTSAPPPQPPYTRPLTSPIDSSPSARAYRLGVTGGIGSGKSTVTRILAELGSPGTVAVVDADAIARSLTAPGGAAIPCIAQTFGPGAIAPDGSLNRDWMRQRAFSDPAVRQQLEAILHPLVHSHSQAQAAQAEARGARLVVLDIPLLAESVAKHNTAGQGLQSNHWLAMLDAVLVVDCTPATQIARVMARNGLEQTAVQRILDAQATRTQRKALATWVILNDGIGLDALRQEILKVWAQLPL